MKLWHWSLMLEQSQKSEQNPAVSRKDECKYLIWNGKYLTSNLHQLQVLLAKPSKRLRYFPPSVLWTSQRAELDSWFCDTRGHSWIWSSWHSVKHQESKDLQVVGTPPQEASGPTQAFETDTGVIDQGLRDFFQNPMAHNSSATTIGLSRKRPPCLSHLFHHSAKGCWVKGREVEEIGLNLKWNYKDIPLDILCSVCRWIYAGIKCDVPSQISFELSKDSHIFSLSSALGSPGVLAGITFCWGGQWATSGKKKGTSRR